MPVVTQPNGQDFVDLTKLAQYCLTEARNNGLTASNPVGVTVFGPSTNPNVVGPSVFVNVSWATPTPTVGMVWLSPATSLFQIATTAVAATNTWVQVASWYDVFYAAARALAAAVAPIQQSLVSATRRAVAAAIAANVLALDLSLADVFTVPLGAAITTFNMTNVPPTGNRVTVEVVFTADGTLRAITWPTGTLWSGGTAPTMTATNAKQDRIELSTNNGGTSWFGRVISQNL